MLRVPFGRCTERIRRAATSAQKSEEQMKRFGGTKYYRVNKARAALETRVVCANSGPCVNIKVDCGPFNSKILTSSILAVLSRMASTTQFREPEHTAVVLTRNDCSKNAFMHNLSQGTNTPDGRRNGAERVLIRLVELAKVCTCRIEWAQTNRVVAKDLWRLWDRKYLAPLTCLSETCMTTGSQRFQERRENVLRNLALREAVYAVFLVGETAVEFPASRPRVVGSQLHLPKFELRQLRDVIKLASEASMGAIQMAWMQTLEVCAPLPACLPAVADATCHGSTSSAPPAAARPRCAWCSPRCAWTPSRTTRATAAARSRRRARAKTTPDATRTPTSARA